jgi:hypothetical protein
MYHVPEKQQNLQEYAVCIGKILLSDVLYNSDLMNRDTGGAEHDEGCPVNGGGCSLLCFSFLSYRQAEIRAISFTPQAG